jgi:anti-sigma regulatory factor (Ser/Thr protein kinase)
VDQAAREAPGPALSVAGWAEDALARLAAVPDVRRVGLALVEGGGRRLRFTASDRDPSEDVAWCHVDAYDDVPLNTAVGSGSPVIGSVDDLAPRYPEFASRQAEHGNHAIAAVPIGTDRDVLGGFVLYFDRPQAFDHGQRAALADLGRGLALGLHLAQHPQGEEPILAGPVPAEGALVAVHEAAGDRESVGGARRFLQRTLSEWGLDPDAVDEATVCVSELVTNAVVHAHGGCVVRAELDAGVLRVSVRDRGLGEARVQTIADPLQVHGRGLRLVEAIASRWGYELDGGALVWFTLDVASDRQVTGMPTPR